MHTILRSTLWLLTLGTTLLLSPTVATADDAATLAFRDAVEGPPPEWDGPVFELSHDYPTAAPGDCPTTVCTWLGVDADFSVDFDAPPPTWGGAWAEYLDVILDYVKDGQDPQLGNDIGWLVDVDGETRWFHVPWMAYDPTQGREFVHGMTNERTAHISDFLGQNRRRGIHGLPGTDSNDVGYESWAFGVYNEYGAFAIGGAWPSDGEPRWANNGGTIVPAGLPFPEGTLVAKLLFTTATPDVVPYLKGSPEWQADRHIQKPNGQYVCERQPQPVRLVQMDVAVVDSRSPTRWVFGTFGYNGTLDGSTAWDRLSPLGLQWGMDPWTFPAVPKSESIPARQSVLNEDIDIYEHFGCQKRLAGPVDNKLSSCLSCHGAGYAQPPGQASTGLNTPSIFGFDGMCTNYSQDNVNYFQTTQFPMKFSGGQFPQAVPIDTSLQMQVAFFQYGYFDTQGAPVACTDPNQ